MDENAFNIPHFKQFDRIFGCTSKQNNELNHKSYQDFCCPSLLFSISVMFSSIRYSLGIPHVGFPTKLESKTLSVKFEKTQNANKNVTQHRTEHTFVGNQGYRSDFGFHVPFGCEIGQTLDQKSVFDSPIGTHPVVLYISKII